MTGKERHLVLHAIQWTINHYPEIIIEERYGKEPTLGLLADEFEKERKEMYPAKGEENE